MGLIKALSGSIGGILAEQWKEYYYCDALDANILVKRGHRRISSRSSNYHGSENIISNGSIISVADGQCMMIVEQGKIVEICAEPGEYIYNNSTEPSIFAGSLNKQALNEVFHNIGKRFGFGGEIAKDQRIYYFNTKEFTGNRYGTPSPVPFRIVDKNIGLDMDITIRCFGEYSYRITNPLLFYTNVSGNIDDIYVRDMIDGQLKSELLTSLQPAFAEISKLGIRYSELPSHTVELSNSLNRILSDRWKNTRGIEIASLGISSIKAGEEDENIIKELQRNATLMNPAMAAAQLVNAQSIALQEAAKNQNAGAAMAFMGMNMANQVGGIDAKSLFEMGNYKKDETLSDLQSNNSWKCSCGNTATGKFCSNCGKKRNDITTWICQCGFHNNGLFCSNCGSKKPEINKVICDKCGWQSSTDNQYIRFCPHCGKSLFNEE